MQIHNLLALFFLLILLHIIVVVLVVFNVASPHLRIDLTLIFSAEIGPKGIGFDNDRITFDTLDNRMSLVRLKSGE